MPPYENNNAQKWWDNFFEASYHGDAGDSEQVQWLYLKPRHSRTRIWPINHAKRTSRGRTMLALNVEGLNLKQKRPFHRRAQTVYWPYLWGIIIFFNIWKCLHVKLIKLYHSEVSNKRSVNTVLAKLAKVPVMWALNWILLYILLDDGRHRYILWK